MKHYTLEQAKKEIGESRSFRIALRTSIKKWKEIVKYGVRYSRYGSGENCGYCLVSKNKGIICTGCPDGIKIICGMVGAQMNKSESIRVLKMLQERQRKNKRRNERRKR